MLRADHLPRRIGETRYFHDATAAEAKAAADEATWARFAIVPAGDSKKLGVHVTRIAPGTVKLAL